MQTKRAGHHYGLAGIIASTVAALACGGGTLAITISTPSSSTRADGATAAIITIDVKQGKNAVDDSLSPEVKVSTDLGEFAPIDTSNGIPVSDDPANQSTDQQLSSGEVKLLLYSVRSGTANINVNYTDSNGTSATKKGTVTFGNVGGNTVASIQWVTIDHPTVNLADSAGQKSLQIQFKVLDNTGSPVQDGIQIAFSLGDSGGTNIDATLSQATGTTANGNGLVSTVLKAGFIDGSVRVTAAAANGVTATAGPIAVEGGPANLNKMTFGCDHVRVAGWEGAGFILNCSAIIGDRNSNFAPNVTVQFRTEAGTISNSVPSEEDPVTGLGKATAQYQTGNPNPIDTTPNALDMGFSQNCVMPGGSNGICNPRDSWVSVIAYTAGEECYTDNNGNGQYDEGVDDFPASCDQGEPFVDANDNGQWDPGEDFVDVDGDGQYTPPNGVWDDASHHDIWQSTVVVWTGKLATVVPLTTNYNNLNYGHCSSNTLTFTGIDQYGNLPACDASGDAFTI